MTRKIQCYVTLYLLKKSFLYIKDADIAIMFWFEFPSKELKYINWSGSTTGSAQVL
jgi:hypothetical protein